MSTHVLKVDPDNNHIRLDVFLTKSLPDVPSRSFVKKLIEQGCVHVNKSTVKVHYKINAGDQIVVETPEGLSESERIEGENIPLNIFYEDEYLLVVNKPIGMLVHPAKGSYTGTLVNALLFHCDQLSDVNTQARPGIVHRLDRDTSGLMVIAKDNKTHTKLAKQFEKHKVKKGYIALVEGSIEFEEGVVDASLGKDSKQFDKRSVQFDDAAKDAKTFYRVIKRLEKATYVALKPQTGRMHQLRVHMAYIKHPILGDEKYGRKNTFSRLALHAQSIGFQHPARKVFMEFSSRPPEEFISKTQA